jgi:hypothetical protein
MKHEINPQNAGDPRRNPRIVALYTDIGRGHPSYLDSFLSLLEEKYPNLISTTVFQQSVGLSLLGWKFTSRLYSISGKGGIQTSLYNLIRKRSQKSSGNSLAAKILGRDLKRSFKDFKGICLVEHPIVAKALSDVCRVWYVHGEIAAPAECAVNGVERILVPLEETKGRLVAQGADKDSVTVCGLMIEPGLVEGAEEAYLRRLEGIKSDQPLTVGFFTSGAYPKEHMEKIIFGVRSILEEKMKAIVFCGTNPRRFEWIKNQLKDVDAKIVEDTKERTPEDEQFDLKLVTRPTRQEDTQRAVELIPHLDAFVAASHERTNYAVGLGLPMFVLFPLIGTFAQQNFEFARKQGTAYPVESLGKAKNLGKLLGELRRDGQILQMAQSGFGVLDINGTNLAVSQF